MSARVLEGARVAEEIYSELRGRIARLAERGVRPGLAAVLVGTHPASESYVRNKMRACERAGLRAEVHRFEADCEEAKLIAAIGRLNADPAVHGILVQLPLPPGLDATRVTQAVAPEKDVDGFGWPNLGALVGGSPVFAPCTPLAVMRLLEHAGAPIEGQHAVVVGRSVIVGKPLALLLIARGATVTVCHTRTRELAAFTLSADLLIAAAGRAGLIRGEMVKPGAVVIDVGITRLADGRLAGDVDFASVRERASALTPVPGGVGPVTIAMLIANTVRAAERASSARAQQ